MYRIGMIGYGNVGKAFARLISGRSDMLLVAVSNRSGTALTPEFYAKKGCGFVSDNADPGTGACFRDAAKIPAELKDHPGFIPGMTAEEVIESGSIDLLVELSSTDLETGEPALGRIRMALEKNIPVVTGNKGPVVRAYEELLNIAGDHGTFLGIGCTTGGALPSLIAGTSGIRGAGLTSFEGVLNGTTNYILSEMEKSALEGTPQSYDMILKKAIADGIAETHPEFDTEGYDTAVKMLILSKVFYANQGYEAPALSDVKRTGITEVTTSDIQDALERGCRLKLIGRCEPDNINKRLNITVRPKQVPADHMLYSVHNKNKGIVLHTDTMGDILTSGGASSPTGAAASILRDILNNTGHVC